MDGFSRRNLWVLLGTGARRLALLTSILICARASAADGPAISYNNQIGPILSEHCFRCHGPDSASRKPKKHPLRLDRADFAYENRDDGKPVIIKGDPDASELVRRITATDDDVMPPASERKALSAEEVALVKQWISQGGKYEKHWSLIPPARPAVPADGAGWARNPVDNFVARKLNQHGLASNPEEERSRLYRRLSLDLTGLPPSRRELEKFVFDTSGKAYEEAVDRMLASDASAENFTRLWLDAVRYADTQGIHLDFSRSIWPYRDWVMGAYKANMPFDRFTIEQIAGDMLPHPTERQKIASGYDRLLETTSEGGAIPEEYAAIYAKDRVDTTAAVWLGLTVGCATCHDHKFDPITQRDFYSLTAFFRNNTTSILDGPNGNTAPTLFLPARKDVGRWKELEQELDRAKKAVTARRVEEGLVFTNWLGSTRSHSVAQAIGTKPALLLPLNTTNGACVGEARGEKIRWMAGGEGTNGPFGPAPMLTNDAVVENADPVISRHGRASFGAFIYVDGSPNGSVISRMNAAKGFRGWDLFLSDGRPTIHIVDEYPKKALKITANDGLESGRWHHVMAVFNGHLTGANALTLYVDGQKASVEVNNNTLGPDIVADVPLRLGGRSTNSGPAEPISGRVFLQDFRFYNKVLTSDEIARMALAGLAQTGAMAKNDALEDLYLATYDRPSQRLTSRVTALEATVDEVRKRGATTLVTEEKSDSKPIAHVLLRGNYLTEGDEVSAATPAALPPMAADDPRNRLGLARWIMSRQDPLVARVTVNRLWSQLFGTGIVETTGDFGVMGARPSDQDLLDWLAVEFVDSGWDFRHMVKTIVMSATYRQSEAVSPEKLEKDPQNRLLSRGPHVRLDAEEIRDQALDASGLLVKTVGGPPVKPYQPEGVWESVAMKQSDTRFYKQDSGEALYRRSLYTFWKRTAPPPNMEILNAPERETSCTRRERTDTPLQALVTLNDTQYVEAARHLATRAIVSTVTFDSRLNKITEPLLARPLLPEERAAMRKMLEHFLSYYEAHPADALALLKVGDSKPDPRIAPADLAAWTLVSSEVLNLDESLTK